MTTPKTGGTKVEDSNKRCVTSTTGKKLMQNLEFAHNNAKLYQRIN